MRDKKVVSMLYCLLIFMFANPTFLYSEITDEMIQAITMADFGKVREIVDNGFNVNTQFPGSKATSLLLSCRNKNMTMVKYFLEKGADPNIEDEDGKTPLLTICEMTSDSGLSVDIVALLIKARADVNHIDHEGNSPLMCAARNGQTEIVQLLIDNKADPRKVNQEGKTASDYALNSGDQKLEAILKRAMQ
jgi:ankyrin repeat protein